MRPKNLCTDQSVGDYCTTLDYIIYTRDSEIRQHGKVTVITPKPTLEHEVPSDDRTEGMSIAEVIARKHVKKYAKPTDDVRVYWRRK